MNIMRKLILLVSIGIAGIVQAQKTQIYANPDYYYNYALELFQKELYGPSIQQFKTYISQSTDALKKSDAEIYSAICHLKSGHENAEITLERMVEKHPENALNNLVYFELGNYYFDINKFKRAAAYYAKTDISGMSEERTDEMNFKMGYSFYKAKKYDLAKKHFESLRNKQGEYFAKANYYYGYMCYNDKQYDCALKSFEKIKDEGFESIPIFIAQMYYAKAEYRKALDYSNKITKENYTNDLNLIKGKSNFQLGKYDEAYKYFS